MMERCVLDTAFQVQNIEKNISLAINGMVPPRKTMIKVGECMVCEKNVGQDNIKTVVCEWEMTPPSIVLHCGDPKCARVAEASRINYPLVRKRIPISWLFRGYEIHDPNHYKHKNPDAYELDDPLDKMAVLVREYLLIPRTSGKNTPARLDTNKDLVLILSESRSELKIAMTWKETDEWKTKTIYLSDVLMLNPDSEILKEMVRGLLNRDNLPVSLVGILEDKGVLADYSEWEAGTSCGVETDHNAPADA